MPPSQTTAFHLFGVTARPWENLTVPLHDQNRCWFADRSIGVRRKYGLTIDPREADALERVLSGYQSTDLVVVARLTSHSGRHLNGRRCA